MLRIHFGSSHLPGDGHTHTHSHTSAMSNKTKAMLALRLPNGLQLFANSRDACQMLLEHVCPKAYHVPHWDLSEADLPCEIQCLGEWQPYIDTAYSHEKEIQVSEIDTTCHDEMKDSKYVVDAELHSDSETLPASSSTTYGRKNSSVKPMIS